MIAADDEVTFAPGVTLCADGVRDEVRGIVIQTNAAAHVALADPPRTVGDAARALVRRYGVEESQALGDAIAFCADLNDRLLLNVRPRRAAIALALRWITLAVRLLPVGVLPHVPARRAGVCTASVRTTLTTGGAALGGVAAALFAAAFAATALALAAFGYAVLPLALAAAAAAASGVVVHELGHLVALRNVPACVVTRGLRVFVLHRPVDDRRETRVAVAGPAAGVVAAALGLVALHAAPGAELAAASLVLSLQTIGFTALTHDGRTLCAPS